MARVIRALRRPGPSVLPAELWDARQQAHRLLEQAREQAQQLRERAAARGLAQGHAQAAASLLEAARLRELLLRDAEAHTTRASLKVAAHLMRDALHAQPERIAALVSPLLERVRRAKLIVLHVHPLDVPALTRAVAPLCERLQLPAAVQIQPQPELQRGDCVLVSNIGELDARIETQLAELERALHGAAS
ncbi:MAG TPA: FliH/SctL family protein [Polyangiales bacterium]